MVLKIAFWCVVAFALIFFIVKANKGWKEENEDTDTKWPHGKQYQDGKKKYSGDMAVPKGRLGETDKRPAEGEAVKLRRYICRKGRHVFLRGGTCVEPPRFIYEPDRVEWDVQFTHLSKYDLSGVDQRDWNKGGGLSFNLWTNHTDGAMWAWRYNMEDNLFDVGVYCHVDGERVVSKSLEPWEDPNDAEVLLKVRTDITFHVSLVVDWIDKEYRFTFSVGDHYKAGAAVPFDHGRRFARTIGAWFGGNQPAPYNVVIDIDRSFEKYKAH